MADVTNIKWEGLDRVLKNLNNQTKVIRNKTRKGMTIVALKIRRDAAILTPVDTGNLRASAYTIVGGGTSKPSVSKPTTGFKVVDKSGKRVQAEHQTVIESKKRVRKDPYAIIGFTAHYALAVHENLTAKHTSGQQAKFLEQSLVKNNLIILKTLKETIKI